MAATPGKFIPALRYILGNLTLEHKETEVAAYLAGIDLHGEKQQKGAPAMTLPSFRWRSVSLNAKAIKALLHFRSAQDDYDGNTAVFNYVFDLDKYGFNRYWVLAYLIHCV